MISSKGFQKYIYGSNISSLNRKFSKPSSFSYKKNNLKDITIVVTIVVLILFQKHLTYNYFPSEKSLWFCKLEYLAVSQISL